MLLNMNVSQRLFCPLLLTIRSMMCLAVLLHRVSMNISLFLSDYAFMCIFVSYRILCHFLFVACTIIRVVCFVLYVYNLMPLSYVLYVMHMLICVIHIIVLSNVLTHVLYGSRMWHCCMLCVICTFLLDIMLLSYVTPLSLMLSHNVCLSRSTMCPLFDVCRAKVCHKHVANDLNVYPRNRYDTFCYRFFFSFFFYIKKNVLVFWEILLF